MARCGSCHGEFEGAKQPLCPLCGAKRPRPVIRVPEPPKPAEAALEAMGAREVTPRRRRKRRSHPEPSAPQTAPVERAALRVVVAAPPVEAAVVESSPPPEPVSQPRPAPSERQVPMPLPGPPPIEVEYVFGGPGDDEIRLVTSVAILPPKPKEEDLQEA